MKRKTSITKIASILTVLAMVWGGVACQQPTEPVEPTKYTITFDSGIESITVEEGTVATEPTTAPEKTGYTFGGWLNGEAAYDWTQPVTSDLSLTAKWTPTEYTITYLPAGVEKDTYFKSYTIESDAIVLDTNPTSPDATKPKFVAWHVDSEEGDVVTEIAEGSTGNKTFYADFSAEEPCVVKFMSGTTEEASTKVKKGGKITLPTGFEKYNLFSDADCTTAFDTTTAITEDTTIYVKLKTFTISYKVLPFNEEGSLSDIPYGTVFTEEEINAFAEKIDGYTYKGVFTDEACTVLFDNTNEITSDLTVYVLYAEEPCVVKFMLGTTEVESTEVKKDTKITLPTGFEKYNLFSDADCTTAFDTTTAITEDTTIYVKLKTFTISYKVLPFDKVNPVEGETNGSMPVDYGKVFTDEEINALAEEIDGYTYKGVFTDEACTVPFDNTNEITSDLTVYVLYEEVAEEPEITYDVVTVDGNTTTILRPTMETAWGATVKGNVISFSGNSAAKWTYKDITNYTFVEIFYETTKESNIKLSMKSSDGDANHKDVGYPELKTSGSLKYSIGNFKDVNENFSHIVLANNANDNDWTNGPTWDDDWSITITKIVLTIVESTGEKVLFDPATFEGETIELDGELYAVVTVDGYNTTFEIDPAVDCSAVSSFKAKMCAKEANAQYNFTVKIADESGADISSMNYYNVESTPKVCSAGYAEKTDWNSVSETNIATTLQPMVQDSANGYAAVSDFVVYIGKVYAE